MHADIDINVLLRLRREAQLRGGPEYDPEPERRRAWACQCGNLLTVADRGVCRECRLTSGHRAN
jgi:hypothetical protein